MVLFLLFFFFTFCLLFCLHFLLSFFKNRTINKRTFLLWPTSQVDRSLSSFVKWEWYLLRYFSFELNALEKLWLNGLSNCIPKLMQFKPSTNHCLNSQQISRMVQSENSICCNTIVLHYQILLNTLLVLQSVSTFQDQWSWHCFQSELIYWYYGSQGVVNV